MAVTHLERRDGGGQALRSPLLVRRHTANGADRILALQASAGNRAVSTLLQLGATPVIVQRTLWGRDPSSGQVVPVRPGPSVFPITDERAAMLRPGDLYDEATGQITRAERSGAGRSDRPRPVESPNGRPGVKSHEAALKKAADLRKQRAEEIRKTARLNLATEDRRESLRELVQEADVPRYVPSVMVDDLTRQPMIGFAVEDERHRVYVEPRGGEWRLMVASLPLPVADFILEMSGRFQRLQTKSTSRTHLNKDLRGIAGSVTNFAAARVQAEAMLAAATAVFGDAAATVDQRASAEEAMAASLHRLIVVVHALAKRLGAAVVDASKSPRPARYLGSAKASKAADSTQYLKKMGSALERYRIEGMVARYREQPDYPGSDFDRDHQPHNDLIETVAEQPEFAGRVVRKVAAGRTQLGWSIMLHHTRHSAGRTFGILGGQVTDAFLTALAARRGSPHTAQDIRDFCVDYLVTSLHEDVARMNDVAATDALYSDLDLPVRAAEAKAAAPAAPTEPAIATRKAALVGTIRAQILAGEARLRATDALVRTYGDQA